MKRETRTMTKRNRGRERARRVPRWQCCLLVGTLLAALLTVDLAVHAAPANAVDPAEPVFQRSLTFDIPAVRGPSGLEVILTEDQLGGVIVDLRVLPGAKPGADLQALFFNTATEHGLSSIVATGPMVRGTDFGDTKDVGFGQNVRGRPETYDFGVGLSPRGQAGVGLKQTSFTLGSSDGALTLDDLGGMAFATRVNGIGAKPVMMVVAPHAPDAVDDSYALFEDGAADLSDPSKAPNGIVLPVLENDTDGDGDTLTVVAVRGATRGTVEIIDGDADGIVGDAVLYTPHADVHGPDSFEYLIDDGAFGTDFASVDVSVAAVADVPTLTVDALRTSSPDQFIVQVQSAQTDLDVSEYIDRVELSATASDGSTVDLSNFVAYRIFDPEAQGDVLAHDFLFTLPTTQSTLFDLHITAVSTEASNGDEEVDVRSLRVESVARQNAFSESFDAVNRSIWGNNGEDGGDVGFDLPLNFSVPDQSVGRNFYADLTDTGFGFRTDNRVDISVSDLNIRATIGASFSARSGQVDATLVYDGTVNTLYNKTVDQLQLSTNAEANSSLSTFNATIPSIGFDLALKELQLGATAGAGAYGYVTFDGAGTSAGTLNYTIPSFEETLGLDLSGVLGNDGLSMLRLENGRLKFVEIPLAPDQFFYSADSYAGSVTRGGKEVATYELSLPNFTVQPSAADETTNVLSGSAVGDLATVTLDLDEIAAQMAGATSPLSVTVLNYSKGPLTARATLSALDYDLVNGLQYVQDHVMDANGLRGTILFEDGTTETFLFGETIVVDNASSKDANGNGVIEYEVLMDPDVQFTTDATFRLTVRDELDILKAEVRITGFADTSLSAIDNYEPRAIDDRFDREVTSQTFALDFGIAETLELSS